MSELQAFCITRGQIDPAAASSGKADALQAITRRGPVSAADIASAIGRDSGTTQYLISQLSAARLIEAAGKAKPDRHGGSGARLWRVVADKTTLSRTGTLHRLSGRVRPSGGLLLHQTACGRWTALSAGRRVLKRCDKCGLSGRSRLNAKLIGRERANEAKD